jgi:conjugative transfer region protein (TIGR03748 family)
MNKSILAFSLVMCSAIANAHLASAELTLNDEQIEVMTTGRYTSVKNIAPLDQLNPLKVVIKTRLPQSIQTVREAIEFLLVRSGYTLADEDVLSAETKILLNLPLPAIHREFGPMTLDRALRTLSGEAFVLLVDPVHRKVGYELAINVERSIR